MKCHLDPLFAEIMKPQPIRKCHTCGSIRNLELCSWPFEPDRYECESCACREIVERERGESGSEGEPTYQKHVSD